MTTTTNLRTPTTPRARAGELPLPVATCVVIFCLLAIAGLVGKIRSEHNAVAAAPTAPQPIIIIASPIAQPVPTAVPPIAVSYQAPPRYVTAWAAPDGVVLGPIPEPAANAILGRYGNDWLMLTWNGGPAWIRAADIGLNLADIAPQIAPQPAVVYVPVSAPAAPQQEGAVAPAYQVDTAPRAAPVVAPTPAPAVQPIYPTLAPMEQNAVTVNWAAEQYRSEHP